MAHIARKRFGQHFLVDGAYIDAIVDAIDPRPGQALVEIGPGLGALTNPLLQRLLHPVAQRRPVPGAEPAAGANASGPQHTANAPALTVIELDRDLAARLRRNPQLEVIEADVLTVDLAARTPQGGSRWRVVGNLPYNISSPILFHLLPMAAFIVDQHFMLQKEVVDRMVAGPGGKDYGRLSVMLQWRYRMENVLDVPPEAFDPPPRVDSAVVRMVPLAEPPALDPARLATLVQTAFSQRRKLLRHTLGPWLEAQGHPGGFDVQRRAEEVPVAEYVAAAQALAPQPL